jgi:predicted acyltransferase
MSLDALRGFDMFWITGGTTFFGSLFEWIGSPALEPLSRQMDHSEWNGFTFYDLIFPLFLFMVGASLPFAISKRVERGDDKGRLFLHVARRAATLLILGFLYNNLGRDEFRYLGVLQRIGLGYFFAAAIVLVCGLRGQVIALAAILLGYWGILSWVPAPGIGAGVLTPEGNLSGYIDRLLLPGHFCCYEHGDSEGILTTLPAIASVLLGVMSSHWLRTPITGERKAAGLAGAGVVSLMAALAWNAFFPINKILWTSSYVLFAGGWSLLLLALFYFVIDVRGCQKWAFYFVVIGMNAITIYLCSRILPFDDVIKVFLHGFGDALGNFKEVLVNLGELVLKWLFLFYLYRNKIFLKA